MKSMLIYLSEYTLDSVSIFITGGLKSVPGLTTCGREMLCVIDGKHGVRKTSCFSRSSQRNWCVNAVVVVVNSLTRRNLSLSG